MKGYNSMRQFVEDYKLYMAAKKIDPGKEGETITSYLRKKMNKRLSAASKQFRAMMKKRGYSVIDLMLIATHDSIRTIYDLESFVKESLGINYANQSDYKKVLSSNAFRGGRLKRLYWLVPFKIETKIEFMSFVRTNSSIPKVQLSAIMNQMCNKKKWHAWLNEMIDENKIRDRGGCWFV